MNFGPLNSNKTHKDFSLLNISTNDALNLPD